jgi:8-O-methyltransferase
MDIQHSEAQEEPSVGEIMSILTGYWQAKSLLTAVEADLFTRLSEVPTTAEVLSERLGYRMPGARDLFLTLTGMGLLETDNGKFRNSPVADRFLVRGRPGFIGGYLDFCRNELNPAWDGLADSLRTGKPQNDAAISGNPYHKMYENEEATQAFLDSMDLFNTPLSRRLGVLDWSGYRSFVDVGGARGNTAHHLVETNPHLTGTVFDLPVLEAAFTTHMNGLDAANAVSFQGGDFFTDPLPEADVLIFGHILHNWGREDRRHLLRAAYRAVRPGGAVLVYDPMVNNGTPPLYAALASLSMFSRWISDNGVSRTTRINWRLSLSATSAARSIRLRLDPMAMLATVPVVAGQTTMASGTLDPLAIGAVHSSWPYTCS